MSVNPTPTIVGKGTKYERIEWHLPNGKLHREDGPAVEWPDGSKLWYHHNKRHRDNGPAIEYADGTKAWYLNDKRHRIDGPAIIYPDGTKEYWLNDEKYSKENFEQVMKSNSNSSPKIKM